MALDFAIDELGLYLVTHAEDPGGAGPLLGIISGWRRRESPL